MDLPVLKLFKINFILQFVLLGSAYADPKCSSFIELHSANPRTTFCFNQSLNAYLSESCLEGKCQALNLPTKTKNLEISKLELSGGKNPSSVKCKSVGGRIHLFEEGNKHQQTFCEASDGSMVSTNAL